MEFHISPSKDLLLFCPSQQYIGWQQSKKSCILAECEWPALPIMVLTMWRRANSYLEVKLQESKTCIFSATMKTCEVSFPDVILREGACNLSGTEVQAGTSRKIMVRSKVFQQGGSGYYMLSRLSTHSQLSCKGRGVFFQLGHAVILSWPLGDNLSDQLGIRKPQNTHAKRIWLKMLLL